LFDPHGDLEKVPAQGFEGRAPPARTPWRGLAEAEQKPIGAGMQEQAELVPLPAMAGSAVGFCVELVLLDQVLHVGARAIDLLIKMLASARYIGHDIAHVRPFLGGLDAGDDLAHDGPTASAILDLEEAATLIPFACQAPHGHVLAPWLGLRLEPGVARQAEDIGAAALLQKRHDFGSSVMAIAAHGDGDAGPVRADAPDHVAQHHCPLHARGPLAGAKQKAHRLLCRGIVDVDRLETISPGMAVELRQLLAAMGSVGGIVDVEDNMARHATEAVAVQIDQGQSHARQLAPGRQVFQARQGWLRGQGAATLGQPFAGYL